MEKVIKRPSTIPENAISGFCPGCMHSTVNKLIGEVLDELNVVDRTVEIICIGCGTLNLKYRENDQAVVAHGRACAVATGYKRCNPDKLVFTYQGDGDLASIGIAETIYAANRGENISVITINNAIYGMTGGQMAPTTMLGQKATTCPNGRDFNDVGAPVHMMDILNTLKAPVYLERVSCNTPANIKKTKAAIKKAFEYQLAGKGFSMVEVISNCPTNWNLSPLKTLEYMKEHNLKEFPLGVVRDRGGEIK
ncbi:thiamine pyrophosphate-dependent enzyme [uncultured Dysosmobacter sp.]|uniref:thiamine pyrophosphate-dependent enzyme n=1 Tax=uncultured Dysosmobacter sp. TaxID=2591384 RepID=UPI00261799E2|nr:thiamine pyrophosphate-dependent enzyme [uncultured Dysosmobacter sp.]